MADEIKKIITIDTGQGITSLKEYKKHIDELRGSLLQLDTASEEYDATAKEIKREQDKLNEVMKVGKGYTDAADGSYNQLVQTMAELKKQWRATADEAERASLGKQILGINNQLKELDASTGNFQRNVGDYSNAFEEAFKNVLGGIQNTEGPLGDVAKQTLGLVPMIKAVNKTATSGLSGIRKGIAATGIGGIIILVSQLITHWKELTAFIGISDKQIGEFKDSAINTFKNVVAGAVGVGNVIVQALITPVKGAIEYFKGLGNIIEDMVTLNFKKIKTDAVNALTGIGDAFKNGFDFSSSFSVGKQVGEQLIAGIEGRIQASKAKVQENAEDAGKGVGKAIAEGTAEGIKESSKDVDKDFNDMVDEQTRAAKEQVQQYNADLKKLNKEAKQDIFDAGIEIDDEQEKAQRIYDINRQLLIDKIALQEEFIADFQGDIKEQIAAEEELVSMKQELANLDKKRAKDVADYETKVAKETAKNKENNYKQLVSSTSSLFGALSDLYEEGSQEQKTFAIMEATINTIASVVGVIKSVWSDTTIPSVIAKAALTATMGGSVLASGIAQIKKIQGVTKNSSSTPEASGINSSVPAIPNVGVSPLLNEEADIQRLQTLSVSPESNTDRNTRVYVVESDITESQDNMKVKIANSTF